MSEQNKDQKFQAPHSNNSSKPGTGLEGTTLKNSSPEKTSPKNALQSTKWIFFILLIAGIGLLSESLYQKFIPSIDQIEMQSQSHFVSRDFYEMYKKGQIPKYFFQLKSIKWSYHDNELKKQIPEESIPLKTSVGGSYSLEVDAFSSLHKTSKIAVLQMSLIEVKTGNKIWELSRNYEIQNTK